MTERLSRLIEGELDEEQQALRRRITEGPRSRGPASFRLVDEDGSLVGPFGLMLHAPRIGLPLQELGSVLQFETALEDRLRELVILMVASAMQSDFERFAHEPAGREAGISTAEIDALRAGTFTPRNPVEASVVSLSEVLLDDGDVADQAFAALLEALDVTQVLEVVALVGYYRTLAQMMRVFRVGAPAEARG